MKRLFSKKRNLALLAFIFAALAAAAFCFISQTSVIEKAAAKTESDERAAIENALFTRAEFFGANAIVPFPTSEARKNLAVLAEKFPDEPQIFLKLSELDEHLGDYEKAEQEINRFVELNEESDKSLEILAAFYERRARFDSEAATLERILRKSAGDKRAPIFARLIELARRQKLERYLQAGFYREIVAQDATTFPVVEQFIGKLIEDKKYSQALEIVRGMREKFPERSSALVEKEIEILLADNRAAEAEAVYRRAFDPFWSEEETEKYYQFLNEQNRFRAYRNELRTRFKKNPADFDAGVRLFHFEKNDYAGNAPAEILFELEKARGRQKINWQPEELLTAARLFLAEDEGEAASRFLYTLFAQNKLEKGGELRAKVLYQLFEMLFDSAGERLAMTNGNLDFYREVAASDPHPGIATGILSLIFSDTNPAAQLELKEQTATKLFNRDAAYRIFELYKQENPASPELAQMYLEIVRLYTANEDTEIAARVLAEFEAEKGFENSPDYPIAALKLADAFGAAKQFDKERAVYQKLLDYLGEKQIENNQPLVPVSGDSEPTQTKPLFADFSPPANQKSGVSFYASSARYSGFLGVSEENVTYSEVLNRLVASLNREKRTSEILSLYAAASAKYPSEAGLDEQMLEWLGQTNLTEEQLKVYQTAIKKFPERAWQHRLARWFLRRERKADFERFSAEVIEKFNDAETQNFLTEFINGGVSAQPETFDARLYLALYTKAHRRFPHDLNFVRGLLNYYRAHKQESDWRQLTAEYYFESAEIRNLFLNELAKNGKLRDLQAVANEKIENATEAFKTLPYKLFRADAAARLSNYEEAVDAYRELDRLYPHTPEYAERLIAFTRSLGQINSSFLSEAAQTAHAQAENSPASAKYRTRAGELQAELGDYEKARGEWQKLIETARGEPETYLATATVFWDYFQYDDALETIRALRAEKRDENLNAFESGAIYEAKKDLPAALREYVKALDGSTAGYENAVSSDRAKRRLAKLYSRAGVAEQIQTAFADERKKLADARKISALVLGYADFLRRAENWNEGKQILKIEAAKNDSPDFLEEARVLCASAEDRDSERFVLRRLAVTASSSRATIKFNLQLADSLNDDGRKAEASKLLSDLVAKFPSNYGVLSETADFFRRIGEREKSIGVLQTAMRRARGNYRKTFGRKLAARFLEQNRPAQAEAVLRQLYDEDQLDYGVFQQLSKIYVQTGQRGKLEQIFNRTLSAIKGQDVDFREINDEVASLRENMINALTRLKDYRAAVAEHIEIINREPENEDTTEAAIDYVRRYGGAEILVDYYQKTAGASFKNYRWFVVLARIYEASKDYEKAAENYRIAIQNQPEMLELYDSLAGVYEKRGNLNAAIETINKTLELSNDDPPRVRHLIRLLENAGRRAEAEAFRQKLPVEEKPQQTLAEQFAEAERLKNTEKTKALETYRAAFEAVAAAPLAHELKTAEIVGYVNALRGAESLDKTANKLWNLRDKLVGESEKPGAIDAGRARSQRQILDAAMIEAIGGAARDFATGGERQAIFNDLLKRLESDRFGASETIALLQNLSRRAGFGLLEEKILIKQKDHNFALKNAENYHADLNSLAAFYRERGDFGAVLNLLEIERARDFAPEKYDYLRQIADNARLVGDREKESAALREYFAGKCRDCHVAENDDLAARYFEALAEKGSAGRNELIELIENPSAFELQLINFLLKKRERELAHRAIENSKFSTAWKRARHAQTSFAFAEFAAENNEYFRLSLQLKPIGTLIGEKPQSDKQLVGEDWFRLANVYGRWLAQAKNETADKFLPALVEQRPHDADQQTWLAVWYLKQKDAPRGVEHSQIALEINPHDKNALANLGEAHFLAGDEQKALGIWKQIIAGEKPDFELYLQTLEKHGRAAATRDELAPILIEHLKDSSFDGRETKNEIHLLANSFGDNKKPEIAAAQAAFWRKIAAAVPDEVLLPETLVSESLIAQTELPAFYESLMKNSRATTDVDYSYTELLETNLSPEEAESALDVRENYKPQEPDNERIKWQREYLNLLLDTRQTEKARKLTEEIEKSIAGAYARPDWLRLAKLRLALQTNKTANTVLPEFKKFVGINPNAEKIIAPSLERLNDTVYLLRGENLAAAADELQTAVYARFLALEKFEKTTFAALAGLSFKSGDAVLGLKLLQTMVDLTDDEKKATAARELAELDLIKSNSVDAAKIEDNEAENKLERRAALRVAAETAAKFEQINAALEFRRQLLAFAPEDAENRLELAKLFAQKQNFDEAANHLAAVIGSAEFSRKARWQAAWTTAEICGANREAWNRLKNYLPDLQTNDEISRALAALEIWKTNSAEAAQKLLESAEIQTANLQFLDAQIAVENGQKLPALGKILAAGKADAQAELAFAIHSEENEMLRQTIVLYAANGEPRAALKSAENAKNLNDPNLLELLSKAAEEIGDFKRSAEFETARKSFLTEAAQIQTAEKRIEFLREREIANSAAVFQVDGRNVSE